VPNTQKKMALKNDGHGQLGAILVKPTFEVMVIDGFAHRIHKTVVHKFTMGDVDDPDLYAAEPLWQWQQSEMGEWVMARAVDTPEWHRQTDTYHYGYQYAVVAKLKERDYTFWVLKWGNAIDKKR
jgi:hypothetical protein